MAFLTKPCTLQGNEAERKDFFPNSAALFLVKTKFSTTDMKKEDGVRPDVKLYLKNIFKMSDIPCRSLLDSKPEQHLLKQKLGKPQAAPKKMGY